jgi:hypothetical protein
MIGSTAEATSMSMREALRSRLGLWDGMGDEMICAHLVSAYERLAYSSFGDRRQLAPASILPRQLTAVPVDPVDLIALAATLFGRLDAVAYTPKENGEVAPLSSAPIATRTRHRELPGASRLE